MSETKPEEMTLEQVESELVYLNSAESIELRELWQQFFNFYQDKLTNRSLREIALQKRLMELAGKAGGNA